MQLSRLVLACYAFSRLFLVAAISLFGLKSAFADESTAGARRHSARYLEDLTTSEKTLAGTERTVEQLRATDPVRADNEARDLSSNLQSLAADRAKVGDAQGAVAAFDRHMRLWEKRYGAKVVGDVRADLSAIDESHAEDAVEAIVGAARSRQIVILNEAHHVAYDRVLAMNLARALRKEGFEYLACETFFINDEHVLNRGYVVEKTGVYSREPTYAKFLMDAQKDGWKFVSYEPSGEPREYLMARNIVDRILAANPKARIFVYAGYSHAMKVPVSESDDDQSKFAAQLRRITGIDPLTINQTTLFAHFGGTQQALYYRHAAKKALANRPAVLLDAHGAPIKLGIDSKAYDFEVLHPPYAEDSHTHRPAWLGQNFQPHDVPPNIFPTTRRRAIYAYLRDTELDAVPLDVVIAEPGKPIPKLMLPAGDFDYEYED